MKSYFIGYDCGTMGTKVAIYSEDGELVSEAYKEHIIKYPHPGWAEMEPDQFYRCVTEGIKECMQKRNVNPKQIKGISCSGIICGAVPIDENWEPVAPYIPFLDNRATAEADYIEKNAEPLWAEEAGNSEVSGYMPPMVMKWFQNNHKDAFKRIKKTATAAQYVLGKLGGLKAKDAFIDWGHLTGWILGYNLKERNWSEEQIKNLGLPYDILPKVVKPWDIVGHLTKEEATKIGLVEGIPLVAGSGDIMQSNLGAGVTENRSVTDVAGTASIFTMLLGDEISKVTDTKTLISGFSTLDNQYLYFGFIPAGGLSLRWFRDEILKEPGNSDSYDNMNKLAKDIPLGCDGVLFYPFLQGRANPAWSNANASWVGLYGSHKLQHLYKSMMESIAFEYMAWSKIFRDQNIDIKSTTIIGGGANSSMWNQMKADILNTECKTLKIADAGALGNAALAAYGVGESKDLVKTVNDWIEIKDTYTPNEENHEAYMKVFNAREKIINGPLKDIFNILEDLKNNSK